jgi:hypothetical protein
METRDNGNIHFLDHGDVALTSDGDYNTVDRDHAG